MKKQVLLIVLFTIGSLGVFAQEYKLNVSQKNGNLSIYISDSDVEIIGYDGSELVITAKGYKRPPQRAEGLKALYSTAVDNTNIGLSVLESGGEIKIEKAAREDIDYIIKIPQSMNVAIHEDNWHGESFELKNIKGEIEVDAKASDIKIEDVSGPIVANTTNGDIVVIFSNINQEKPNSIKSVNGYIDLTMPESAKCDIKLRALNGEIYSNFEIAYKSGENDAKRIGGGGRIEGKINGGGVELQLNTINDNIYLRKAE